MIFHLIEKYLFINKLQGVDKNQVLESVKNNIDLIEQIFTCFQKLNYETLFFSSRHDLNHAMEDLVLVYNRQKRLYDRIKSEQ